MDWVLLSGIKSFHDLTFRFKGAAVASEPGSVSCVLEVSSHRHFFFSVVKLLLSALRNICSHPFQPLGSVRCGRSCGQALISHPSYF